MIEYRERISQWITDDLNLRVRRFAIVLLSGVFILLPGIAFPSVSPNEEIHHYRSWEEHAVIVMNYRLMMITPHIDEPQVIPVVQKEVQRKTVEVRRFDGEVPIDLRVRYHQATHEIRSEPSGERIEHMRVEGNAYHLITEGNHIQITRLGDEQGLTGEEREYIERDYRPTGRFEAMVKLVKAMPSSVNRVQWTREQLESIVGSFAEDEVIEELFLEREPTSTDSRSQGRFRCRMKIRSKSGPGTELTAELEGFFEYLVDHNQPLRLEMKGPMVLKGQIVRAGEKLTLEGRGTMTYRVERMYNEEP